MDAAHSSTVVINQSVENSPRWCAGERLFSIFEDRMSLLRETGDETKIAIEAEGEHLSYGGLSSAVDRMATALKALGIKRDSRVGLVLDRSIKAYVAYLAVVKTGAIYIPLDEKFPDARISFIVEDAGVTHLVTTNVFSHRGLTLSVPSFTLYELDEHADGQQTSILDTADDELDDTLAYIIYTSGSTGQPKGVAINHSSICNFIRVARETYGLTSEDRVYQGLTFAFDFSVEEFWVPLACGATLVASPSGIPLVGKSLSGFLRDHQITALCCVPTLLASMVEDLPQLNWLLVSGESCPPELVARWSRPGRTLLNAYGPTEATVTATLGTLDPAHPVTIGKPLPTYSIVILDPATEQPVAFGEVGEIAIAGIGLAEGYINKEILTREKFVADTLHLAHNPAGKLYKTGDLGRVTPDGEIEYLGRRDSQVKLKGYRIELSEIESVLMSAPGIGQAAVKVWDADGGKKDLVAYVTTELPESKPAKSFQKSLQKTLNDALPDYMVPTYIEYLDQIPLTPSQKIDRNALPSPTGVRLQDLPRAFVAPKTSQQQTIADILAKTLRLEKVSAHDHFFNDLGLDSLLAAQFLSAVHSAFGDAALSIADIYQAPTVETLSDRFRSPSGTLPTSAIITNQQPIVGVDPSQHFWCGVRQATFFLINYLFYLAVFAGGAYWILSAETAADSLLRSVAYVSSLVLGLTALAVATKWLVIGQWTDESRQLWSPRYFRFWVTRAIVESAPLAYLRGSPLFNLYLNMLGANVALNAVVLTRSFPLITDLLEISSGAVLRKNAILTGYRAERGVMRFGRIRIGRNALVGENSLVDINTEIGAFGSLAHASALLEGEKIAQGERRHGSPSVSVKTDNLKLPIEDASATTRRCILYAAAQLAFIVLIPSFVIAAVAMAVRVTANGGTGFTTITHMSAGSIIVGSAVALFVGGYVLLLTTNLVLPRALRRFFKVGDSFPVFGTRYFLSRIMVRASTQRALHILFGDSSFVVDYVRWLGMKQPDVQQTGSNFGTSLDQDDPFQCQIGSGTMVSDDFSIINHEIRSDRVTLHAADVGSGCFVGNDVTYPANASTGNNCLLASRVMIPTDGPIRENVGLLGSPAFEIPRRSGKTGFDPVPSTAEARKKLAAKDRYNAVTIILYLSSQLLLLLELCAFAYVAVYFFVPTDGLSVVGAIIFAPILTMSHFVGQERLSVALQNFKKTQCTIHDPYFWWVERYWKFAETPLKYVFRGTPFRPAVYRLLGAKLGKFVFDDGSIITEKPLTEIGAETIINAFTTLQSHSLEDGLYKADWITIGRACTLGTYAYVHYATELADGTTVAPDCFIMKGSTTRRDAIWLGNPGVSMGAGR